MNKKYVITLILVGIFLINILIILFYNNVLFHKTICYITEKNIGETIGNCSDGSNSYFPIVKGYYLRKQEKISYIQRLDELCDVNNVEAYRSLDDYPNLGVPITCYYNDKNSKIVYSLLGIISVLCITNIILICIIISFLVLDNEKRLTSISKV